MKNTKKALIIDPYLKTLGGAEKYVLSIAKIFEKKGLQIHIVCEEDSIFSDIEKRFDIHFSDKKLYKDFFTQDFFKRAQKLKNFDIVLYITDGSYFFSLAKKNYTLAMYPQKNLYKGSFLNRLKWLNSNFITFSEFSNRYISNWIGKRTTIIYPFIENDFLDLGGRQGRKSLIILSVGRFFTHLHSKKQEVLIEAFEKLREKYPKMKEFKLVLAGGLCNEDKQYFESLRAKAKHNTFIEFKPNISRQKLIDYYKRSMFYWHGAGYGEEEILHPEKVEHLGITPLEAMAAGCLVFAYRAGGPKELIKHKTNGILYENIDELIRETNKLYLSQVKRETMSKKGQKFVREKFTYEKFGKKIIKTFRL